MEKKKMIAVLAITVMAVPLVLSGCGKDIDEVPVEDTQVSVESTVESEVNETIEEDLADVGIEVTPTPEATPTPTPEVNKVEIDTSMADTYYIIIQDQNIYKEPDVNSDIITTCIVDTMITVSGIHEESGMFEVVDANGDIIGYVESGFCDTIKGGYQSVEEDTTTSTEDTSDEKTEVEQNADEFMGSLTEEEQQELLDQIESSRNEGIPNSFWEQYGQGGSSGGSTGVGQAPIIDNSNMSGGDYSDANPNVNMN